MKENTVDQHQQMTWHPKPSLTVETLHWTSSNVDSVPLLSSSKLWDPDFRRKCKMYFHQRTYLWTTQHSSSPVLFVFSPGETILTLSVVQEWLDKRNATAETHVLHTSVRSGSWSTDSSCSPLFVNLPHIFEWVLFHNPLQGAVIPIACTLFSTTSFPSLRLSINVLGHRALWTASLFCNDLLCLALLVQGVNGRLLDNCQVSSLPHDCVAYRTRLRDHLKAFAGVLS